jgi:hypothetical protein
LMSTEKEGRELTKTSFGRFGLVAIFVAAFVCLGAPVSLADPPLDTPNKACPDPHPGVGIPPFCPQEEPTPPPAPAPAPAPAAGTPVTIFLTGPGEGPRGIWCNGSNPLILVNPDGGTITIPAGYAVNLDIPQGLSLEAKGLVAAAFYVLGVGATCSVFNGVTYVATQPLVKVNNLGLSIPGDPGAIYWLGHKA